MVQTICLRYEWFDAGWFNVVCNSSSVSNTAQISNIVLVDCYPHDEPGFNACHVIEPQFRYLAVYNNITKALSLFGITHVHNNSQNITTQAYIVKLRVCLTLIQIWNLHRKKPRTVL